MLEKVSVIVPIYNVEQYIDKCIESIVNQTYRNIEIILVDDGSPDACPKICDDWASRDARIRVIHKQNGGLSDARNCGLDMATGDYLLFVDSDDWIDCDSINTLIANIKKDERIDVSCGVAKRIINEKAEGIEFNYYDEIVIESREVLKKILMDEIGSQVVIGLYKRRLWDNIRFPVGRLYEDIPTTFLVFAHADLIYFSSKPFYNYRINGESISFSKNPLIPYHIYLGMKSHYDYAVDNFKEIAHICCAKTGHYAISTLFHYYVSGNEVLFEPHNDVKDFLNSHRKEVFLYKKIPFTRRLAMRVYFLSPRFFKMICRFLGVFVRR